MQEEIRLIFNHFIENIESDKLSCENNAFQEMRRLVESDDFHITEASTNLKKRLHQEIEQIVEKKFSEEAWVGNDELSDHFHLLNKFTKCPEFSRLKSQILQEVQECMLRNPKKVCSVDKITAASSSSEKDFHSDDEDSVLGRVMPLNGSKCNTQTQWGGGFSLFDLSNLPEPLNGPNLVETLASEDDEAKIEALSGLQEVSTCDYWMHDLWEVLVERMGLSLISPNLKVQLQAAQLYTTLFQRVNSNQAVDLLNSFLANGVSQWQEPKAQSLPHICLDNEEETRHVKAISCHELLTKISVHLLVIDKKSSEKLLEQLPQLFDSPALASIDPSASWIHGWLKGIPLQLWRSFLEKTQLMNHIYQTCQDLQDKAKDSPVLYQNISFLCQTMAFFRGSLPNCGMPELEIIKLILKELQSAKDFENSSSFKMLSNHLLSIASACNTSDSLLFRVEEVQILTSLLRKELQESKSDQITDLENANVLLLAMKDIFQMKSVYEAISPLSEGSQLTLLWKDLAQLLKESAKILQEADQLPPSTPFQEAIDVISPFLLIPTVLKFLHTSGVIVTWVDLQLNEKSSATRFLLLLLSSLEGQSILDEVSMLTNSCQWLIQQTFLHNACTCGECFEDYRTEFAGDVLLLYDLQDSFLKVVSTSKGIEAILSVPVFADALQSCYQADENASYKCIARWCFEKLLLSSIFLSQISGCLLEGTQCSLAVSVLEKLFGQYVLKEEEQSSEHLEGLSGIEFEANQASVLSLFQRLYQDIEFKKWSDEKWQLSKYLNVEQEMFKNFGRR